MRLMAPLKNVPNGSKAQFLPSSHIAQHYSGQLRVRRWLHVFTRMPVPPPPPAKINIQQKQQQQWPCSCVTKPVRDPAARQLNGRGGTSWYIPLMPQQ